MEYNDIIIGEGDVIVPANLATLVVVPGEPAVIHLDVASEATHVEIHAHADGVWAAVYSEGRLLEAVSTTKTVRFKAIAEMTEAFKLTSTVRERITGEMAYLDIDDYEFV